MGGYEERSLVKLLYCLLPRFTLHRLSFTTRRDAGTPTHLCWAGPHAADLDLQRHPQRAAERLGGGRLRHQGPPQALQPPVVRGGRGRRAGRAARGWGPRGRGGGRAARGRGRGRGRRGRWGRRGEELQRGAQADPPGVGGADPQVRKVPSGARGRAAGAHREWAAPQRCPAGCAVHPPTHPPPATPPRGSVLGFVGFKGLKWFSSRHAATRQGRTDSGQPAAPSDPVHPLEVLGVLRV
jgi:hypothetical protein